MSHYRKYWIPTGLALLALLAWGQARKGWPIVPVTIQIPGIEAARYPSLLYGDQETGQSGSFASAGSPQVLLTSSSALYRVSCYIEVPTPGSGGTVSLSLVWNDDAGAETFTTSTLSLASTGYLACPPITIKTAPGNPVGYYTTVSGVTGIPLYNVFVEVEAL